MNFIDYFGVNYEHSEKEDLIRDIKALIVAQELTGREIDTLMRAWSDGLMVSGDTPSKVGISVLLEKGILCQTCWRNNDYYTFSVTYPFGYRVCMALLSNDSDFKS